MAKFLWLPLLLLSFSAFSQSHLGDNERFPIFPECEDAAYENEENCFKNTLKNLIFEKFNLPDVVAKDNYSGEVVVLFEVTENGVFEAIYIDAVYPELKEEIKAVFEALPEVKPATYNSLPINMQFRMPIKIPLSQDFVKKTPSEEISVSQPIQKGQYEEEILEEFDKIKSEEFEHPRAESKLNI
ncbi:MAG TPA: gliding motility protein RemB, partial [Salinimicrobium sp.]|nr:gliding motility protein RemB [Salinimicrobium sp.]